MKLNPMSLGLAAAATVVLSQIVIVPLQFIWNYGTSQLSVLPVFLLVTVPIQGVIYFCTAFVLAMLYNRFNGAR